MKKVIPIVLVLAGLATGFLLWQKASKTAALVSDATPDIPTSVENPELLNRIQTATTQAKEGPEAVKGLAELSRLYHANGFTREAWQCYAALVLAEPSEARWPYHFGRILAGYGQLEEATPYFEKARELAPDYIPARIRLGDTLLKQNRFEEAKNVYANTLSKDDSNAYALVGLARVAISNEDWSQARTHLEKAVSLTNYQIGADLLGDVYKRLNLPHLENRILQTIVWGSYADIPDPWSLSLMNDSYDAYQVSIAGGWTVHQGDVRTGLRYVQRAVKLDPDSSTLHFQLAGVYMKLGQIDDAETHYQLCVKLQPDFADAWLGLIEIAKQRQSPTLVRRTLQSALRAAPDSPSLNIEKGDLLLAQKQFDQAIAAYKKSIEVRPQEAVGYISLAQAYLAQNRVEEGVEQMREALQREPHNLIALTAVLYDAISRSDKKESDYWFARVRQLPRIGVTGVDPLENMYRQAFRSEPPQ
ncbi:tetratricopeptide repeat protein [Pelagicoccus sp. SDUM812002]|uniref:tetratricopeptide repeat protein n=1 Tax=Pelagicoccus sp. SDUM812002 TaxID=3041266 RepID=UPI0028102056|nr:tetratricopeptide repeat protein [Pelagicoccus sp. SDUM812002]MDQ8187031.1 tetratricopeptide repeat protein [Pelagicoccus sp. SDUM812002]